MNRNAVIGLIVVAVVIGASLSTVPHYLSRMYTYSPKLTFVTEPSTSYREVRLEGVRTFTDYVELLDYLSNVAKLSQFLGRDTTATFRALAATEVAQLSGKAVSQTTVDSRVSKTNVQVEGIDEPDVAKTDGEVIAVAADNEVFIVDAHGKRLLSRIELDSSVVGMFLRDKKLVIISTGVVPRNYVLMLTHQRALPLIIPAGTPNSTVYVVDITNSASPEIKLKTSITGSFLTARLVDSFVYVLTTLPLGAPIVPAVNGEPLNLGSIGLIDEEPDSYTTILALDIDKLDYSAYSFLTGPGSWIYMSYTKLYVGVSKYFSTTEAYRAFLEVLVKYLPADIAGKVKNMLEASNIAGALEAAHEYLNSVSDEEFDKLAAQVNDELSKVVFSEKTVFYVFRIYGLSVSYLGMFSVLGVVLDQFSMEEFGNYFIIATTGRSGYFKMYTYRTIFLGHTGKPITIVEYQDSKVVSTKTFTPASKPSMKPPRYYTVTSETAGEPENSVFVINLENLSEQGSLKGLAKGERIYSARLVKNILFLVTYRQVDPLFAIDLSNPDSPRVLGYLKIPGFSEYLHPLDEDRLLGIGLEDSYLKLSLFDVSNPAEMREVSKVLIECSWSPVFSDHRAVTVDPDFRLVYIPMSSYCYYPPTSGLGVARYGKNSLSFVSLLEVYGAVRALYVSQELYVVSPDRIVVYSIPELNYIAEIMLKGK